MIAQPAAVALQGLRGSPLAMALQGFAVSVLVPAEPEGGGGRRGRRPRPQPWDVEAQLDARDIEALLIAGAL